MRTVVDTAAASSGRETVDGVHYNEDVYKVVAQVRPRSDPYLAPI